MSAPTRTKFLANGLAASPAKYLQQRQQLDRTAELQRRDDLIARLKAFSQDCVEHGDMSPAGQRMLLKILTSPE